MRTCKRSVRDGGALVAWRNSDMVRDLEEDPWTMANFGWVSRLWSGGFVVGVY